jgi:pyruvate kinase
MLSLSWGIRPIIAESTRTTDEMLTVAIKSAISTGLVEDGDYVVMAAGLNAGGAGSTNLLVVHEVGVEFGVPIE